VGIVEYASPLAGPAEHDRPLTFGHSGAAQALRRELRVGWPGPKTKSLTSWSIVAAFSWSDVSVATKSNASSFSRPSPRMVFPFFTNFDGKTPVWNGAQTALSPTNVTFSPKW
jgi:hypothetical protein